MVRRAPGRQGWKLHVSSIPTQAADLIARVAPILEKRSIGFKIARDEGVLECLNAGQLGGTQIGKFMTIYPPQESVRELAIILRDATEGFAGPIIATDRRLGPALYTRYGSFSPTHGRDRLGRPLLLIDGGEGLREDTYSVPFTPPAGIPDPLRDLELEGSRSLGENTQASLFGPGYLVIEAIKKRPKGAMLLGMDLRSQGSVGLVVIKQGRKWCLSDRYGRDIRWRLEREYELHREFASVPWFVPAIDYFEDDGDGYLVLGHVKGQNLEAFAEALLQSRPWFEADRKRRETALQLLHSICLAVQEMHRRGYVHRDLSPANIWITPNDDLRILDLEMMHRVGDSSPAVGLGTYGFISPQQYAQEPPSFADDVYALGGLVALTLTGLDPRRLHQPTKERRIAQLEALTRAGPGLGPLFRLVARARDEAAAARPELSELTSTLEQMLAEQAGQSDGDRVAAAHVGSRPTACQGRSRLLLERGIEGLLDAAPTNEEGIWLSLPGTERDNPTAVEDLVALRGLYRGAAGGLYCVARLAGCGYRHQPLLERADRLQAWLLSDRESEDRPLPGLHFGEAGVAVALQAASRVGLVASSRAAAVHAAIERSLEGRLDWHDVTHGAAGQGLAALICHPPAAARCAEYLVATQQPEGYWLAPPGAEGVSGQCMTGFAHGVAGIVYFLAVFAQERGAEEVRRAWQKGAHWLQANAIQNSGNCPQWPYSDRNPAAWKWWCHGGPGIALAFLKLFELTREAAYLDLATRVLDVHPVAVRSANLSQCHGLAGLGEIYLEALRLTGDDAWRRRADEIVGVLEALAKPASGHGGTWLVDDPTLFTADFAVGLTGVLHFLMRFAHPEQEYGFPCLT